MREIKYIIIKDKITGRLKKLCSEWLHHSTIARDNGYNERDIIEAGVFLDRRCFILECKDERHIERRKAFYIGSCNEYQFIRLSQWLKGRELESYLYYNKRLAGQLIEGD